MNHDNILKLLNSVSAEDRWLAFNYMQNWAPDVLYRFFAIHGNTKAVFRTVKTATIPISTPQMTLRDYISLRLNCGLVIMSSSRTVALLEKTSTIPDRSPQN